MPAATFRMGSDAHYPEEAPEHEVAVEGFWIDRTQVTNRQFDAFVAATGCVTVAERPLYPAAFPSAPAENLVPGSLVFTRTRGPVDLRHINQWWTWTPGACWRHPEGPGSSLAGREEHHGTVARARCHSRPRVVAPRQQGRSASAPSEARTATSPAPSRGRRRAGNARHRAPTIASA